MMVSNILNEIGDRIRVFRVKKKLSQENMATELEISVTAYSKIERGQTNISIGRLEQISLCLDVPLIQLMCPVENIYQAMTGGPGMVREAHYDYFSGLTQQVLPLYLEEKLMRLLDERLEEKLTHFLDEKMEEKLTQVLEEKLAGVNKTSASAVP